MNKLKTLGVIAVAVVLSIGLVSYFGLGTTVVEKFGAAAGPDVSFRTFFREGIVQGGAKVATTSTATTYTLTGAELNAWAKSGYLAWTPNVNTTLSLGATSTNSVIPNIGDKMTLYIQNASTTAAATITLAAADTGLVLEDGEDNADLAINGTDWASLTFIRTSSTIGAGQIMVLLNEWTD